MGTSRKTQQLDVNTGRIEDPAVRDAITAMVNFVNQMTQNLSAANITAETFTLTNKRAGFKQDGSMFTNGIFVPGRDTNDINLKMMVFRGSLGALGGGSELAKLQIKGRIFGAIGYSSYLGGDVWQNMDCAAATGSSIIFYDYGLLGNPAGTNYDATDSGITILNSDNANSNSYRVIVFYQDVKT